MSRKVTGDKRPQVFVVSTKKNGVEKVVWNKDSANVAVSVLESAGHKAWWELHTVVGGEVIIAKGDD